MKGRKLTEKEIRARVFKRIKKYSGLSLLEQFGMFMGSAQVLELSLKGLLNRRYQIEFESMERWTLGQVKVELENRKLRPDFIAFLESVVHHRNYVAHSLLANEIIIRSVLKGKTTRHQTRDLHKAIYELEQLWVLFHWTEKHKGWRSLPPNKALQPTRSAVGHDLQRQRSVARLSLLR